VAAVSRPWNAVPLVGFLVAMFWHAQLGLQVILEDYIHESVLALALQVTVKFIAVLGAIVSVFAVARIALGSA
jgi:succinate dehydrogenase / fumarate reductase membrane anchor subunit